MLSGCGGLGVGFGGFGEGGGGFLAMGRGGKGSGRGKVKGRKGRGLRHTDATFLTSTVMAEVSRIFKRSCERG